MLTYESLVKIMPFSKLEAAKYVMPLNEAMAEFEINTPLRQAAFLAQVGHESGQLHYVKEIATGEAYEGRKDLGNTMPGDGVKYKGRGLIQITGRENYIGMFLALGIDCVDHPELIEEPINACRSAALFWKVHGLNELADKEDFLQITKKINGGTNGIADREELYQRAKDILCMEGSNGI